MALQINSIIGTDGITVSSSFVTGSEQQFVIGLSSSLNVIASCAITASYAVTASSAVYANYANSAGSANSANTSILANTASSVNVTSTSSGVGYLVFTNSSGSQVEYVNPNLTVNATTATIVSPLYQVNTSTFGTVTTASAGVDFCSAYPNRYKIGFDSALGTVGYLRHNVLADAATNTWGHVFGYSLPTTPNTFHNVLFIGASGNVGIGNTNPTTALQVNGNVTATSFIGTASYATSATNAINATSATSSITAMFATSASAVSGLVYGLIAMWHGTVASIPSGWHLCDGTAGTPDLRNLFVVGASGDSGSVAVTTITGVSASYGGAKTSGLVAGSTIGGVSGSYAPNGFSIIPPFYALAYIMKV